MNLSKAINAADELAHGIFMGQEECAPAGSTCLDCECARPMTAREQAQFLAPHSPHADRPFYCYDHENLCLVCQARWFAGMAGHTLRRIQAGKARAKAQPTA